MTRFWDVRGPRSDIGTILASIDEADAVSVTPEPLLAILDEPGPTAADADYVTHPRWGQVARAATDAHQLMTGTST